VEEACSWVEYCNSDKNATLVQQRRENGIPKPYDVQFWGIGNENWICGILAERKYILLRSSV